MPVVTRSQKKLISKDIESKSKVEEASSKSTMSVVTRSQKKLMSKDVESKSRSRSRSKVEEVPLDRWFIRTIISYLTELSELNKLSNYEDQLRVVNEMYYIINQHFEYGVARILANKNQVELTNLAIKMYVKTKGLIDSISLLKKSQVPMKLKQLTLDELNKAKKMLYPYVAYPLHDVVKDFSAENEFYDIYEEDEEEPLQDEEDEDEECFYDHIESCCSNKNKHSRFVYSDDE
jgi:hypothetical protein